MPLELKASGLYTRADAGRLMQLSPQAVLSLVRSGALVTKRVGLRDLVTGVSIAQYTGAHVPNVPAPVAPTRKTQKQILQEYRLGF